LTSTASPSSLLLRDPPLQQAVPPLRRLADRRFVRCGVAAALQRAGAAHALAFVVAAAATTARRSAEPTC
jgi:hypothetical protein